MSHVSLAVICAVSNEGTLVERDALCTKWSIQILNLPTLVALECSDKGLP